MLFNYNASATAAFKASTASAAKGVAATVTSAAISTAIPEASPADAAPVFVTLVAAKPTECEPKRINSPDANCATAQYSPSDKALTTATISAD